MTEPKINPLTGHEDSLPNPRPRSEIWKELLASHQVDPNTRLVDIYYTLKLIIQDLEPFVDEELAELSRIRKMAELKKSSRKK